MVDSDHALIFVEVKTRTDEDFQAIETAITYPKKKRMISAARHFIHTHEISERPFRFDVLTVSKEDVSDIRHYPNAFVP